MHTPLHALIVRGIRAHGPLPYARYMELALHHPDHGYYASGRAKIGPADGGGDFTTAPHFSRLFGRCLARLVVAADRALGHPDPFTLVEGGPGEGKLGLDLLDGISEETPDLYRRLRYAAEEASPALRTRQRRTLSAHEALLCDAIPNGYTGLYLSNELLDAFPFHRFRVGDGDVKECFVEETDGKLALTWGAPTDPALAEAAGLLWDGGEPYVLERCPGVGQWLEKTAGALSRGYLVTIDYGDTATRLYGTQRPEGTCRGYRQQRHAESLLEAPGETDLTGSVDFSELMELGEGLGLVNSALLSQRDLLFALGVADELTRAEEGLDDTDAYQLRQQLWPLLFSGTGMGESFKALVQAKEANLDELPLDPAAAMAL